MSKEKLLNIIKVLTYCLLDKNFNFSKCFMVMVINYLISKMNMLNKIYMNYGHQILKRYNHIVNCFNNKNCKTIHNN